MRTRAIAHGLTESLATMIDRQIEVIERPHIAQIEALKR
jgi:hypothetical protein